MQFLLKFGYFLFNLSGNTARFGTATSKTKKIDKQTLQELLIGEKSLDYLDYSPSSKILTVTRNPFGFKNNCVKGNK